MIAGKDIDAGKIDELLKEGFPSSHLMFNEGRSTYSTHRLCKRCAAMANVGGGMLVLGVTAKNPHKVVGSQAYRDPTKLEKMIASRLYPTIRVEVVTVNHPQGRVMCIIVPPGNSGPVGYKHVWYSRIGEQTRHMPLHELRRLLVEEKPIHWLDDVCVSDLSAEEVLDMLDVEGFYRMLAKPPAAEPSLAMEDLARSGMVAPAQEGKGFAITRMGALLLAKSIARFPAEIAWKRFRIVKYGGKTKKAAVLFDQRFDQGHASGLEGMVEMIVAQTNTPGKRKRAQLVVADFPYRDTLRELLVNAIIHQDFGRCQEAVLEIFADRMEFANPGASLVEPDCVLLYHRMRNPQLNLAMREFKLSMDVGRGLNKAVSDLERNCAPPLGFEAKEGFTKITLFYGKTICSGMSKRHKKEALYQHCLFKHFCGEHMTDASARSRFNLGAKGRGEVVSLLDELVAEGKIKVECDYGDARKGRSYHPH